MKKNIIFIIVFNIFLYCHAQEFRFKMQFVDSLGNKDSISLGYDADATDTLDILFGETNIIGTAYQSGIDVRVGNVWFQQTGFYPEFGVISFETKTQILPNTCGTENFWQVLPIAEINIVTHNYPVTAYWEKELFDDSCRDGSVLTSIEPGCWWDCGGFRADLKYTNSVSFDRNGTNYYYLNGSDTVFVYFAAVSDSSLLMIGIEEQECFSKEMQLFPNPAMDKISIIFPGLSEIDGEKSTALEVYNLEGKMIISKEIPKEENQLQMDVSSWPSGMYYLRLVINNQTVGGKKVVVD